MSSFLEGSTFFGVTVSLIGYQLGVLLKRRFKNPVFNPLLISILFVILMLLLCRVRYEDYNEGAKYISFLLTPATVCLALPLYQQMELLKSHIAAILAGSVAGVLTALGSVFILAKIFGLNHQEYVTLLPKSITTAIGMGISEELGGIVTITVAVIIITGILGNVIGEGVCKLFRIKQPIAKGLALGTAAHAIGTARAMEMGEVEGAISSLAIAVSGLLTVIGASIFAYFI
ncbi:LrgB family protein [Aminipila luticellarii]|uniref:LrgB family protein n=1 Tax=Aminipila luticellarii TaxID=2507160 RepID=A0A410PY52_9FIRM|nr:LrgB family protein [Aminipila luticellarii]QAT43868.1 LrgB family protein [Aminipila luticellarii]